MNDYGVDALFPEHFRIADLGCSSGPNTLLVLSNIIDNVHAICQKKNLKAPEFQVFLNDLPDNDFNTIFKMLPPFYAKVKKEKGDKFGACFVSGVSGSFYTRLFPCRSLHFVHSSYSLHWLSQVPENLENNKGNIYMSKKSPPNVYEAYWRQYLRDFSTFLRIRSEEITDNGRMVLTFLGRSGADPTSKDCCCIWDLLATSLHDMVAEGLIGEADINSFNIPIYNPCMDEVKAIIQMEGLFILNRVETFEVNWGVQDNDDEKQYIFDKNTSGKAFAKTIRAVAEPMLASHFGNTIIDNVFQRIRSLRLSRVYQCRLLPNLLSSPHLTSLRHPNLFFTIAFILFYFTTTAPSSIPILKKTNKIQKDPSLFFAINYRVYSQLLLLSFVW